MEDTSLVQKCIEFFIGLDSAGKKFLFSLERRGQLQNTYNLSTQEIPEACQSYSNLIITVQ
jgi:hypothetical protein